MSLPEPFVFSQSALTAYTRCPRQFELRYMQRQPWPAPEMSPVLEAEARRLAGLRFHRLAQQAAAGVPLDLLTRQAEQEGDPMDFWWENFVQEYKDLLTRRGAAECYPEITLSAPLGKHRLVAKFDLLVITPDQWTIYDWKTENRPPKREHLRQRWQTRVYLALLAHSAPKFNHGEAFPPEQIRMTYWYANFPDAPVSFDYTQTAARRDWQAIAALVQEIAQQDTFPQTDDAQACKYCVYRSYCGRGVSAGDWQNADTETDKDDLAILSFDDIAESAF